MTGQVCPVCRNSCGFTRIGSYARWVIELCPYREALELHFDSHRFAIEGATFRYITDSWSGPGWDFRFSGTCLIDNEDEQKYPYGIRLLAEAAPLPLERMDDFTGATIELNMPYDEDSGDPYFGPLRGRQYEKAASWLVGWCCEASTHQRRRCR